MKLPPDLKLDFAKGGGGEVCAMARALYDLTGNLGETYVATDGKKLAFFSHPIGCPVVTRWLEFQEIARMQVAQKGVFLGLRLQTTRDEPPLELKFSSWDKGALEKILAFWTQATGRTPDAPSRADDLGVTSGSSLSPLAAFCASIHAMASIDGHLDQGELLLLSQAVPDAQMINRGMQYYSGHGLEALLSRVGTWLNEAQKRCLYANLIAVGMTDGTWASEEQELLERFRVALGLSADESQRMNDVLMMVFGVFVLGEEVTTAPGIAELTPVTAFCACLQVMAQSDEQVAPEELEYMQRRIGDPDAWAEGNQYLEASGVTELMRVLGWRFGPAQKRCLMANLLAMAMADGLLRSREQELLEQFQSALEFPVEDYATIRDVLMTKNDLRVFAQAGCD